MTSQPAPKPPRPTPDDDDEPVETNDVGDPKKIGKYDILKKLGQGGMGAVFLARDAALRRDVALKVLPKDKAENPTLVRRFQAEAQAAAKLRHDNIVAVYDSDTADGMCYIAMEFVDGKDLHEMVSRRGPVPIKRSIEIIKQVAQALQHAYEHNIVHRDIKPSNLLIRRDGMVKLTDLGLARSVDDSIETGITRAGTTVGTVDYMAPEQGRSSKAADIRSDLYSLGCTWYFMLTGQPPFPDGSLTNKLQAHAIKAPPDPRAINENVSDGLVAVIHRLLEKKPENRYQTPAELIEDLNTSALTRNAIAREIFDEPEEVAPPPTRSGKKPVLPDDLPSVDAPSRGRSARKSRVEQEDEPEPAAPTARRGRSDQPGPDVDIYAEEAEEAPVRKQRVKAPMHSLDDESAEAITSASSSGKASRREPGVLPPPSRRVQDDKDEPQGINLEWLKIVGAAVAVVIVVGGLGWLVSSYSSNLFFSPNVVGPAPAPAASGNPEKREVEVAAVGGSTNSDKPILDSGTQVAMIPNARNVGPDGQPLPPGQAAANATGVSPEGGSLASPTAVAGTGGNNPAAGTATVFDPEKIPEWANAKPSGHSATITVGPGANTATHFGTLSEALSRVGPEGALIQLIGSGPFVLSTPSQVQAKRLILSAEPNSKPIVVFGSAGEGLTGSLHVSGHLEINGLHLSLDRQAWKGTNSVQIVTVKEGTLTLRDSTATVSGKGPTPVFLFNLDGNAPGGTKLLIDRSYIRGEPTVALNVRADTLDAMVRDSVIAVDNATAFRLSSATATTGTTLPPRAVRSVHTTWCASQTLFDISGDRDREAPPVTHFVFQDSICTTGSDQGPRVLLAAVDWLQDSLRQSVVWTSKSSALIGFDNLLDLGTKSAFRAKNAENWRLFWQQKVDADQFLTETWPTGLGTLATVSALEFDRQQAPAAVQKLARKDSPVGTETTKLLVPESTHPARLAALSQRRPVPTEALQAPPAGKTRRVDLKKEDLGVILSRADWSNGTLFEAVGFGNCLMSPVQLQGRQLRIVFLQGEGAPLKIVPKDAGKDVEALIRIERGSIELEDLRYQAPESRATLPAWFLAAVDSQVVLRQCELIGPEKLAAPYLGGVKFAATANTATAPASTLSVMQCLLQTPGTTIRAEGSAAAVFVRNSLIASRGAALDLRPTAVQGGLSMSVDLVQSTLSATDTVFQMLAATGPISRPLSCFVENCAFGPPFSLRAGDAESPSLMTLNGPVLDQQQLAWWGQSNGVSKEIRNYVKFVNPAAPPITDAAKWSAAWGDGHDLRLLAVADGVLPQDPLPARRDALKGSSYTLHSASKGITWADGRPIGADGKQLDGIGPQKPAPEPASTANSKKATPNTKTQGASKTGGF